MVQRGLAVLACGLVATLLVGCSPKQEPATGPDAVEIAEARVSFELPDGWLELDQGDARDALDDDELMAELVSQRTSRADTSDVVETFIRVSAVPPPGPAPVLIASATGVEGDVLAQVSVTVANLEDLPPESDLTRPLRQSPLGVEYLDVSELTTAFGPALLETHATQVRDPSLHWAIVVVDTGTRVLDVRFVTHDREMSEQLATDLAASLQRTS